MKLLEEMADDIKKQNNQSYDCFVPVSGGKDIGTKLTSCQKVRSENSLCIIAPHLPTKEGIHNLNEMIKDLNVDTLKLSQTKYIKKNKSKKFFCSGRT